MVLSGAGVDAKRKSMTVVFNATPGSRTRAVASLSGTAQVLHPALASGADQMVKGSTFDASTGTFAVPARSVAVFG